jgi:hypothetical protein
MMYEVSMMKIINVKNQYSLFIKQLCALRPPFLGDSFPALKRAITLGRYSPIPRQYCESIHGIIGQMLRLSPRDRPSADMLLKSSEILIKLHLDETLGGGGAVEQNDGSIMDLINTIKVPQNLNKLNSALPKPCYPDLRPNSPTSWTVAEQRHVQRKPPPLPPVSYLPLTAHTSSTNDNRENIAPILSSKDDGSVRVPVPTTAIDDFYNRRPLAPVMSNKSNVAPPHRNQSVEPVKFSVPNHNRPQPVSNLNVPSSLQPHAPSLPVGHKAAGNPTRLQYHHKIW